VTSLRSRRECRRRLGEGGGGTGGGVVLCSPSQRLVGRDDTTNGDSGRTDGRTDRPTDRRTKEQTNERRNERTDGRTDGRWRPDASHESRCKRDKGGRESPARIVARTTRSRHSHAACKRVTCEKEGRSVLAARVEARKEMRTRAGGSGSRAFVTRPRS